MFDDEICRKIEALDLTKVRKRFLAGGGFFGKMRRSARVRQIEAEYRQFLYLAGTAPTTVVPWTTELDEFWHEHILHTRDYRKACADIFGKFIHHDPGLPRGTPKHTEAYKATRAMYRSTFVEKLYEVGFKTYEPFLSKNRKRKSDAASTGWWPFHGAGCGGAACGSTCSGASCGGASCGGGGCGGGGCGGGS